ncbi:MAG TPA: hypothetical protein PLB26_17295 [Rubrivivax sp.]|nr:hypothetical protein [Rubrivivax sp.]
MFPEISIKSDLDKLIGWSQRLVSDQIPFATALALTKTAQDGTDEMKAQSDRLLDRPTPFTQRAWMSVRATKTQLVASVRAREAQAAYLQWQVFGGDRAPNRKALKLPTAIKLNDFGNIPRGEIARLIKLAQEGKRLTRKRGQRLGISSELDLFYGDPGDGMPPGIYKRVVQGAQHRLIPLIVFPARAAHYKPRLPMLRIVEGVVRRRFALNFGSAWRQALASAR